MATDQDEIHRLSVSENVSDRSLVANILIQEYYILSEKSAAWEDLHKLTIDKDWSVRRSVASAIGSIFSYVPDKSAAWKDLHKLTEDTNLYVRKRAAESLGTAFLHIPDEYKSDIWDDLNRLINDDESDVILRALYALKCIFKHIPDQYISDAWGDIHKLTISKNSDVRLSVAEAIGDIYSFIPDKYAAWNDIHHLTRDKDPDVRLSTARAIGNIFPLVFDKCAVLEDIHHLTTDKDPDVRLSIAGSLGDIFPFITNDYKSVAWRYLIQLSKDEDWSVRRGAVSAIGSIFPYVPDKSAIWKGLHNLTYDNNSHVKRRAVESLGTAFLYIPDEHKSAIWDDLHRLTSDDNSDVRRETAYTLGDAFKYIPDKYAAWNDLHLLMDDADSIVRRSAAYSLCLIFEFIPTEFKSRAWFDLQRLISNEDKNFRRNITLVLVYAFKHIPDEHKSIAWEDIHQLASDEDRVFKRSAAEAISSIFPYVPDKFIAWNDLIILTKDVDSDVKMYANHSLGKVCIYKASKSENESKCRSLLKDAIQYFKTASNEGVYFNPAIFCYLFYCSFDAVLFRKVNSKKEIEEYIEAAKEEIRGSKSKQKLVEAVEQLAEVLDIAYTNKKDGNWQVELKRCSEICNHVEQLMLENKERTPLICDIFENNKLSFRTSIKKLIEAADAACKEAKGTPAEAIVYPVKKEIQGWEVEDQELMEMNLDLVVLFLKSKIPKVADNTEIIGKIDQIKSYFRVEIQMGLLASIISSLPHVNIPEQINKFKEEMNNRLDKIDESQHRVDLSLEKINQRLDNNYDKLRTLSFDFKRFKTEIESEYIDTFENEIRSLIAERDYETLDFFAKKLVENRPLLFEANDESNASEEDKIKGEKSIFELRSLPHKIKEIIISSTTDVSKEVVVSLIANMILESVFPILGPAAKEVVKILESAIRSREKSNKLY